MMEPRLTVVTLGVGDLVRSTRFYESLGWTRASQSNDDISFFRLGDLAFALFPAGELAKDAGVEPATTTAFRGFSLAHNVDTRDAVDRLVEQWIALGGSLLKPAEEKAWGGYSAYVADPDGFAWEIAWPPLKLD